MRKFIQTEEESKKVLIEDLNAQDKKFVKRKISRIEEELDDAKTALDKRLQELTPIDESVVEVAYGKIKQLQEKLELYESFKKENIDN